MPLTREPVDLRARTLRATLSKKSPLTCCVPNASGLRTNETQQPHLFVVSLSNHILR